MDIYVAKGETLDKLATIVGVARKRIKSINLIFGWKLIKEESDNDYRNRIYNVLSKSRGYKNE